MKSCDCLRLEFLGISKENEPIKEPRCERVVIVFVVYDSQKLNPPGEQCELDDISNLNRNSLGRIETNCKIQ